MYREEQRVYYEYDWCALECGVVGVGRWGGLTKATTTGIVYSEASLKLKFHRTGK